MQVWRMAADGSGQEQVTDDAYNNWFPHLSPDGRRMVFLSYDKDVTGHPEDKDVLLRIMSLDLNEGTLDAQARAALAVVEGSRQPVELERKSRSSSLPGTGNYQMHTSH